VIIKLAQNHPAIDFLIINDSELGVGNRTLYLVQVSVQQYQKRSESGRYSAINQPFNTLSGETPMKFYKKGFGAKKAHFMFASNAEDCDFGNDKGNVYHCRA